MSYSVPRSPIGDCARPGFAWLPGISVQEMSVDTTQSGRVILEYFRRLNMKVGDSVPVDDLAEYAIDEGIELDEIEDAIVHASSNGWIDVVDEHLCLTIGGHRFMTPANDNR